MRVPLRVVAAALIEEGRVLVARRAEGRARGGLWELPGGKVEPGEDDSTALRRELREELGIEVTIGDMLGEVIHPYPERTIQLIAYRVRLRSGTLFAHEHAEIRWLPAAELHNLRWAPADIPLLAPLTQALRRADP